MSQKVFLILTLTRQGHLFYLQAFEHKKISPKNLFFLYGVYFVFFMKNREFFLLFHMGSKFLSCFLSIQLTHGRKMIKNYIHLRSYFPLSLISSYPRILARQKLVKHGQTMLDGVVPLSLLKYYMSVLHTHAIGTSMRRSSQLAFGWSTSTGNDVSGQYKHHYFPFFHVFFPLLFWICPQ